jgi:ubiquinone/menaquinone biosynthesis C-methylase UbiE
VPDLCCPSTGGPDPTLLANIPDEVVARDYGCGNPTAHLRPGETVLDLGSGSGKACFLAAQIVGPAGRVIGVDRNDDMLALARGARPEVARRLGFDNVRFVKARIEDLALDREALDRRLAAQPVASEAGFAELERWMAEQRATAPLVPDASVDVVISNCVLNLVLPDARRRLFAELARVLRPGGRAIISDVTCDGDVPEHLQRDPALWSGCLSGAFREDLFLKAFADAGLRDVQLLARSEPPWQVVEGLAFRSVTVRAVKGAAQGEPFLVAPACGTASCC